MESNQPAPQTSHKKLILAIVVIVAVLAVLFVLANKKQVRQAEQMEQQIQETVQADAQVQAIETQGTSDDLTSIEADLNSTDVTNLDQ